MMFMLMNMTMMMMTVMVMMMMLMLRLVLVGQAKKAVTVLMMPMIAAMSPLQSTNVGWA